MARHITMLAAVAVLMTVPNIAGAEAGLFPQQVIDAGGGWNFAKRLDEPPLWKDGNQSTERIRLFVGGFTRASWSIRLDQSLDGRWTGYFREHDGRRLFSIVKFKVSTTDVLELKALIAKASLWDVYPQFWTEPSNPGEICLDGETVIFERMDHPVGYRYSEGNAPCTIGEDQAAVAAKLLRMAGRADLERYVQ